MTAQIQMSHLAQGGHFRVHGAIPAGQDLVAGHGHHPARRIGDQGAERPALAGQHSLTGGFDGGQHVPAMEFVSIQ